jgi:hypothetical protein
MMKQSILWQSLLALGICSSAFAQPVTPGDAGRIVDLIKLLGSSNYPERVTAQNALEAIGVPALEQLKTIRQPSDLEASRRIRELVRKIEEKEIARDVLAPRRVRFSAKDMPVRQAVALLAKESGYDIEIADNRADLVQRTVTLDTGLVPFWEAYEILCKKGGLVERGPPPHGVVGLPSEFLQGAILSNTRREVAIPTSPRILLSAGPPLRIHSSIARGVRVRLYEIPGTKAEDFRLLLEARPEPRLPGFAFMGSPQISKALDDVGQERLTISENVRSTEHRQMMLTFVPAKKPAMCLETFSGTFDVRITGSSELIYITVPFAFENVPLD